MFTIFCRFAEKHLVRLDSYFLCFVFIKLVLKNCLGSQAHKNFGLLSP